MLIGGRGYDTFLLNHDTDFGPGAIDVIKPGDGAVAFDGAGHVAGDVIWLPNATWDLWTLIDFSEWTSGSVGKGRASCIDASGGRTLVRGNMDEDAAFAFQVLIDEGRVLAEAYCIDDFVQ